MSGEMTLEEALAPIVADPSRSALLLDVDGTLAPIVRDPEDASVGELFRRLLVDCTESYALVGCVSGRQASEARRIVGIGSIPYAGNHGLELLVRGSSEAQVNPEAERWMGQVHGVVARQDQAEIAEAGLRVEDKGTIVGLHWRGVDDEAAARALAERIAEEASEEGLHLHRGRNVIEIRPPVVAGKDGAVKALLDGAGAAWALYAGDDRTDLDAFSGLRELVAAGELEGAVCVGVLSDEAPPELLERADVIVDGEEGVRELLSLLARA